MHGCDDCAAPLQRAQPGQVRQLCRFLFYVKSSTANVQGAAGGGQLQQRTNTACEWLQGSVDLQHTQPWAGAGYVPDVFCSEAPLGIQPIFHHCTAGMLQLQALKLAVLPPCREHVLDCPAWQRHSAAILAARLNHQPCEPR